MTFPEMAMLIPSVNDVPPIVVNAALALLSGGCGLLVTLYFTTRKEAVTKAAVIAEGHEKMKDRVTELERTLAQVNAQVIPISTAFQAILIKELTHFHTPEMDALMVKIGPPNTLTPDEEKRLAALLVERTKDMGPEISDSERDAAAILPAVMKRSRIEQETIRTAESLKLKLVTVVTTVGVPGGIEPPK
jgi:hypothetical protein